MTRHQTPKPHHVFPKGRPHINTNGWCICICTNCLQVGRPLCICPDCKCKKVK